MGNSLNKPPFDESYLAETKADDYLLSLEADVEADAVAKDLHEALFAATEPMYYRWFLLSDYDRVRRLPNPPFLPNYRRSATAPIAKFGWSCPVIAYQNQKRLNN